MAIKRRAVGIILIILSITFLGINSGLSQNVIDSSGELWGGIDPGDISLISEKEIPDYIRINGLKFESGYGLNLCGIGVENGKINIKNPRGFFLDKKKEARSIYFTTPKSEEKKDEELLLKRSGQLKQISIGMTHEQVIEIIGTYDDMFQRFSAENGFEEVRLYKCNLDSSKAVILWFNDKEKLIRLAEK